MAIKALVPEKLSSMAFFGAEISNPPKITSIDATADALLTRNILSPKTPSDRTSQNGRAIHLIAGLKGGADQVNRLEMRADPGSTTTEIEKEQANEALDVLAKATYIVMRYGGDPVLSSALNTPAEVDAVLPVAMQGLGERVMENIITNPDVMSELESLDKLNARAEKMGKKGDEFMMSQLNESLNRLAALNVPVDQEDELTMALAYLSTVALGLEASLGVGSSSTAGGQDELVKALLGETRAKEQFQTFTGNILVEDTYRIQDEALPLWFSRPDLVGVPGFEGADGNERWQRLISVAAGMNNWVAFKRKGDYKIEYLLNAPELKGINQEKLTKLFVSEPGFRLAAKKIFADLFVRDDSFPDPDVFAIRLKRDSEESRMPEWMNSFSGYMKEKVAELVATGMNEDLARLYVATAAHIFVDVTTVDFADKDRSYNGRAMDPIRSLANPEKKANDKAGIKTKSTAEEDQMFGGKLWDLENRLADLNPDIPGTGMSFIEWVQDAQRRGDMLYFPKCNGLSWVEMDPVMVNVNGHVEHMTIAQLLMTVDDSAVDYENTVIAKDPRGNDKRVKGVLFAGGGDDGLCGVYQRDIWPAIVVLGNTFKGGVDLDVRDWGKIKTFAKDIGNGWRDLLKATIPGTKHPIMDKILNHPRYLAMAIVNAWPGGQLPLHHEIVLPIQPGGNYDQIISRDIIANLVGVTPERKRDIMRILHANEFNQATVWNPMTDGKKARRRISAETARNQDLARKKGMVL